MGSGNSGHFVILISLVLSASSSFRCNVRIEGPSSRMRRPRSRTIDDGLPEVLVVQHTPPRLQRFVRRKDYGPMSAMPLIHHVKEHVRGISAVREMAHLVDD